MASPDESIRYVGESHPYKDPSEATSKRAGSQSMGPSSGRSRNLRRMAASICCLIDEEEGEVGGNKGEASSRGEEGRVVIDLVAAFSFHDGLGIFHPQVVPHYAVEKGVFHSKFYDYLCPRSGWPCPFSSS
ncbi:UNVERIFIED_CONTAM: hypothetical protein Slati_1419500 [Sesamum latifolium]|uniref:Uncharacterized protein n=1 Tax=Sesamum latifolium TaxID=2727402 RepID=A0AAW2X913_9LAMI